MTDTTIGGTGLAPAFPTGAGTQGYRDDVTFNASVTLSSVELGMYGSEVNYAGAVTLTVRDPGGAVMGTVIRQNPPSDADHLIRFTFDTPLTFDAGKVYTFFVVKKGASGSSQFFASNQPVYGAVQTIVGFVSQAVDGTGAFTQDGAYRMLFRATGSPAAAPSGQLWPRRKPGARGASGQLFPRG